MIWFVEDPKKRCTLFPCEVRTAISKKTDPWKFGEQHSSLPAFCRREKKRVFAKSHRKRNKIPNGISMISASHGTHQMAIFPHGEIWAVNLVQLLAPSSILTFHRHRELSDERSTIRAEHTKHWPGKPHTFQQQQTFAPSTSIQLACVDLKIWRLKSRLKSSPRTTLTPSSHLLTAHQPGIAGVLDVKSQYLV